TGRYLSSHISHLVHKELSVLVGTEITLSCVFDTPSKLVEWSALSIEWNMVDKHAKKSMVYMLEDGRAHVYKEGSVMNETRLRQSDASLQLHNVTVRDEGLYTCRVINPLIYTESTALKVLGILAVQGEIYIILLISFLFFFTLDLLNS
uniref:Ig-like domain-containing protein n=1 Tax=Amphilophus citrinellus TaxID=61819 RepID=A0A3Q0QRY5_AMPCI